MAAVFNSILIGSNHPNDISTLSANYIIEIWENSRITLVVKNLDLESKKRIKPLRFNVEDPEELQTVIITTIKEVFKLEEGSPFQSNSIGILSFSNTFKENFYLELREKFPNVNIFSLSVTSRSVYSQWGRGWQETGVFNG